MCARSNSWKSGNNPILPEDTGSKGPINTPVSRWACSAGPSCSELKSQPLTLALHLPEAAAACQEKRKRRKESYHAPAARSDWQISRSWLMTSPTTILLHHLNTSLSLSFSVCVCVCVFVPPFFYFLLKLNDWEICRERDRHTNWKQRRACSPCCGWTFCLSKKKKKSKEKNKKQ